VRSEKWQLAMREKGRNEKGEMRKEGLERESRVVDFVV